MPQAPRRDACAYWTRDLGAYPAGRHPSLWNSAARRRCFMCNRNRGDVLLNLAITGKQNDANRNYSHRCAAYSYARKRARCTVRLNDVHQPQRLIGVPIARRSWLHSDFDWVSPRRRRDGRATHTLHRALQRRDRSDHGLHTESSGRSRCIKRLFEKRLRFLMIFIWKSN